MNVSSRQQACSRRAGRHGLERLDQGAQHNQGLATRRPGVKACDPGDVLVVPYEGEVTAEFVPATVVGKPCVEHSSVAAEGRRAESAKEEVSARRADAGINHEADEGLRRYPLRDQSQDLEVQEAARAVQALLVRLFPWSVVREDNAVRVSRYTWVAARAKSRRSVAWSGSRGRPGQQRRAQHREGRPASLLSTNRRRPPRNWQKTKLVSDHMPGWNGGMGH